VYSYYFIDIEGNVSAKLKQTPKHRLPLMSAAAWSQDESVLFSGGFDKSIKLWTAV
jgi:WD40 repeat protein